MINLTTCLYHNLTENGTTDGSHLLGLKDKLTIPICLLLLGTLLMSVVVLIALVQSGSLKSSTYLLYFNLSLADVIMAFIGLPLLFLHDQSSNGAWDSYQILSLTIFIPRSVWMQTVLCLMINRYKLIRGKPEFSIFTTYSTISFLWFNSALQAILWHCLSPGGSLNHLNTQISGVILNNLLTLAMALPLPVVMVLLVLIAVTARKHISRIVELDQREVARQMEGNLRLLYLFGAVYVLGFGLTCANNLNNLINLCGYLHVITQWSSNKTYCQYLFFVDGAANVLVNFANSLIILQSRYVKVSMKKMYRNTSRIVRNITRQRTDNDLLIQPEPEEESQNLKEDVEAKSQKLEVQKEEER